MSFVYTLVSVLIISAVSFIGAIGISIREDILKKYVFVFVSLAVGALLGDALIHLIPEAVEELGDFTLVSILIIAGIFIFFIIEKFLHWHHHEFDSENHVHPVGKMILLSDGVHNLIDGIIIGASYMVSIEVGIATTLAVVLHEIPQEIGDFGVLIHSGYTKSRALFLNFLSALTALIGAGLVFIMGEFAESLTVWFLPIAAGGFIYIAMSDLIPELHKEKSRLYSVLQVICAIIGVLLMAALLVLE